MSADDGVDGYSCSLAVDRIKLARPGEGGGRVLAYCQLRVGGCVVIRSLRLIRDERGMFVAMPSIPREGGSWYMSVAFPIDRETRERITRLVVDAYLRAVADAAEEEVEVKPLT